MDEKTRRKNFERIAEERVNTITAAIRSMRRFTNKSFYKYDEKDVKRIFNFIETELEKTKECLTKGKDERFKL